MKKLSLVVSSCLLSTSVFASTIDEAFKNGEVEGSISLYSQSVKFKKTDSDTRNYGYGNGNLTLGYTTGDFYGFNLKTEAKGNLKLWEKHKHDRKDKAPFENNALITQAYIQYELADVISAKAGRYEGEFEWLSDYQQGAVVEILPIPDTVVALAYSNRKAESGIDVSEDFKKANQKAKDGVYLVDIKNNSIEDLTINPYYYNIKDITSFYGLKLELDNDYFGAIAHYAKSNAKNGAQLLEDGNLEDVKDGSILHLEATAKIEDFGASLGFIKTRKENGVAGMDLFGDSINPFEDGEQVYGENARTIYAGLAYSIAGVDLGLLYGITKYNDGNDKYKEKELNLGVGYNVTDNLNVSAMYVNVKNNNKKDDVLENNYNKYIAAVEYSF